MKRLIRLENTLFGFSSFCEEEVDKILDFNPDNGTLKVQVLERPEQIPFKISPREKIKFVEKILREKIDPNSVRIVHNPPIKDAYSAPFKIYLDITTECQLRCPFCLSEIKDATPVSLPFSIIHRIAAEAKELGIMLSLIHI